MAKFNGVKPARVLQDILNRYDRVKKVVNESLRIVANHGQVLKTPNQVC